MHSTRVNIHKSGFQIDHQQSVLTIGSCFAENIGRKLHSSAFAVKTNPFGVVFNPVSVADCLWRMISDQAFQPQDLFQHGSLWSSFSHSSLFSGTDPDETIKHINVVFKEASAFIRKTDIMIITFGTAWVYESVQTGSVVANCHKLPAANFRRRRLSVADIVSTFSSLIDDFHFKFPHIQRFIFTVSPIRHVKDGLHENQISKSILLMAIDELQQLFSDVEYFPAYEIQLDELRDYRYYADDMLHPSKLAIDYIWQRFAENYFSVSTFQLMQRIEDFNTRLNHRPIHPETAEHMRFLESIEKERDALTNQYPFLVNRL